MSKHPIRDMAAALFALTLLHAGLASIAGCHRSAEYDPGKEFHAFFATKSVSVVRNLNGVGKFKYGEICGMANEWTQRVATHVEDVWYLVEVTKNDGGECPVGTLVLARAAGLERLQDNWEHRDELAKQEAEYEWVAAKAKLMAANVVPSRGAKPSPPASADRK